MCSSSFLFAPQVTQQLDSGQKHAYDSTVLLACLPLAHQCLGQRLVSSRQNPCGLRVVWLSLRQLEAQGAKQNLQASRICTDSILSLPIHSTCTSKTHFGEICDLMWPFCTPKGAAIAFQCCPVWSKRFSKDSRSNVSRINVLAG